MDKLGKFTLPKLFPPILHREELLASLMQATAHGAEELNDEHRHKLILVCAPAGYGKTTLLADFAQHSQMTCCWYFLDASDNDKFVFLERLMTSLRRSFPEFGQSLDALLSNMVPTEIQNQATAQHFESFIDSFSSQIETEITQHFTLILCNYHEVNGNLGINSLVSCLLRHLPPQCVLIIESRTVPALELDTLAMRRELLVLDTDALRFSTQEVYQLAEIQVQASVRLAACLLAQGRRSAALQRMETAIALTRHKEYEHLVQIELRRQPALAQMTQGLMTQGIETPTSVSSSSLPGQKAPSVQISQSVRFCTFALGEPAVLIDGSPVTRWRMARAMELYFFLLDSSHPVRKEQIITALWPEADERVDQTFRSTIHYLRKAIGDACIVYHAGAYSLHLEALYGENVWYDITAFLDCRQRAQSAQNDDDAYKALQEMITLYRGDFVQFCYNDWSSLRRDELRSAYMDARTQLAHITWRRDEFDECLLHWQHLLTRDSCLEDAHYGIMCCYLRLGKRTQALRQYQRCKETLHEELSIAPGPTIQKLYQRLLQSRDANSQPARKKMLF